MAFANMFSSAAKPTDHDLTTPSTTPPPSTGVSTPQVNVEDRRFPSILSSYFAQVRESFHASNSSTMAPTSPVTPAEDASLDDTLENMTLEALAYKKNAPQHAYPTPPMSSSSSCTRSERNGTRSSGSTSPADPDPVRRPQSAMESLPSHLRRTTLSANPSSCTSTPTILATHLTKSKASGFSVSHHSASASQQLSAALQTSEDTKLTENAVLPRNQTPPRTPRTLSHESKQTASTSHSTASSSQQESATKQRHGSTDGALMGDLRGKLSVQITAGRGLKPSIDPYVVCQFQYNEYISRGPWANGTQTERASEDLRKSLPMQRSDSDSGRPMAIPMKSRQSSQTSMSGRDASRTREVTDPVWNHDATFDVVGDQSEIDISVYDRSQQEVFLGHIRVYPSLTDDGSAQEQWLKLEPRDSNKDQHVNGEIHIRLSFQKTDTKHYGPEDFEILKLIGKGTFGQVFQVRKRDTKRIYAMKVLEKKVIVQKKEVAHTVGERNILVRTAMAHSPFIVGLKFSFQTPTDLYLVTDYMSGGELFWHLQKESRFHEERAKFYIAELILALQHLHDHDIVYRDLKPENILLDANGHVALCDFGLSKANLTKDETTNTFCGTTEYLAPEVLLDENGYTKMVDFWSLGVLVFEMVCGWSPFYADDTQQMYKNIAFGKVRFPRDALSGEGRNFVKGLLNRNPKHRLGANGDAEELKAHPFFDDVDWIALAKKNLVPPFKPRLTSETDTSNFDPEFTNALNGATSLTARAAALAAGANTATTPLSPTMQANFQGFTFVDESALSQQAAREDAEAMDEDGDIKGWEAAPPSPTLSRSSRMSGVQNGVGSEEGMFGTDGV